MSFYGQAALSQVGSGIHELLSNAQCAAILLVEPPGLASGGSVELLSGSLGPLVSEGALLAANNGSHKTGENDKQDGSGNQ